MYRTIESETFSFELPSKWRCKQANAVGGPLAIAILAGVLLTGARFIGGDGAFVISLRWMGYVFLALSVLLILGFAFAWAKSEFRSGLPRLGKDLIGKSTIIVGNNGEWAHLTSDRLRESERPPDSHELSARCHRYYGGRLQSEGMISSRPVALQAIQPNPATNQIALESPRHKTVHQATYLLGNRIHKKYTIYLFDEPREPIEIVITAKITQRQNAPIDPALEKEFDRMAWSCRV